MDFLTDKVTYVKYKARTSIYIAALLKMYLTVHLWEWLNK